MLSAACCVQVERLQGVVRDRRANWAQSIATLEAAKAAGARVTKTSIMLGCGEAPAEVVAALRQLRDAGGLSAGGCSTVRFPCTQQYCSTLVQVFYCGRDAAPAYATVVTEWVTCRLCTWCIGAWLPRQRMTCAGVDVVTLGQYMRPTKRHMAVSEYVTPEAFAGFETAAKGMGFLYVAAGPLVRSSYRAGEFYLTNVLRGGEETEAKAAAV